MKIFKDIISFFAHGSPPYVSYVGPGWIGLEGPLHKIEWLSEIVHVDEFEKSGIRYDFDLDVLRDQVLQNYLIKLNESGFAFLKDIKLGYCPSSVMELFQEHGILKTSFKKIFWTGSGSCKLVEVFPNDSVK